MALEDFFYFQLITNTMDCVVVELSHKVFLKNFAPRLYLKMLC